MTIELSIDTVRRMQEAAEHYGACMFPIATPDGDEISIVVKNEPKKATRKPRAKGENSTAETQGTAAGQPANHPEQLSQQPPAGNTVTQ